MLLAGDDVSVCIKHAAFVLHMFLHALHAALF